MHAQLQRVKVKAALVGDHDFAIEDAAPKPKSTSKKSAVPKTKANTSKPRAKAATAGRVEKKKAPATKNKRTPTVTDKVKGVVEKVVGTIEGKPAKKVYYSDSSSALQLLWRRSIAVRLMVTSRLLVRRRSRALMERDLPARKRLNTEIRDLWEVFLSCKNDGRCSGFVCALGPPMS